MAQLATQPPADLVALTESLATSAWAEEIQAEATAAPEAVSPTRAAVESTAGRMQVELGGITLEVLTESKTARAHLTLTEGRWQVRIVDAGPIG